MSHAAPLLLAAPTRFAGLPRRTARALLGVFAGLVLAALLALAAPAPHPATPGEAHQTDLMLYTAIVERMGQGDGYYAVAADALRTGGYPLKPFVAFRLPTLAAVQATVPAPALVAMLWALVAAVLLAWWYRLSPAFARASGRLVGALLLLGGCVAFWQADLLPFHELWAGLFVALSLARRSPARWGEAVAFGLAAMLVRETAALYVLVMAAVALAERARAEALGWAAALALFAIVLGVHAHAVSLVTRPLDPMSPGWAGMLGSGFPIRAWVTATALGIFPMLIAAPLAMLSWLGWAAWRDPLGVRMVATLAAYGVLMALFARADNFYWVLLIAPASLAGLAFVPDALRDLLGPALDTRRITVRRVAR